MASNRFTQWLNDERNSVSSAIIDAATDFLTSLIPSHANVPTCLELNNRWHYLDKEKTCGYRGHNGTDHNGVPFLKLTFNDFKNGGFSDTFKDSYGVIKNLWEQFKTNNPTTKEQRKAEAQKRAQKRQAQLAKDAAKEAARTRAENIAKAENVQRESARYWTLPTTPTNEQNAYIQAKSINAIPPDVEIRYGTDKHGDFAAILLQNIKTDEPVGVQRFYAHPITKEGTNKKFTWGMQKKGAGFVMGHIDQNTPEIITCESFADGLRLYTTHQIPVVVVLDANGYQHILPILRQKYPHIKGYVICDNDEKYHKMDNVGIIKGIEAAQKSDFKIVIPQFGDYDCPHQPTDVSDLYALGGEQAIKALLKTATQPPRGYAWQLAKLDYIGLRENGAELGNRIVKATKPLYEAVGKLCRIAAEKVPLRSLAAVQEEIMTAIHQQQQRLGGFKFYNEGKLLDYARKTLHHIYDELTTKTIQPYFGSLLDNITKHFEFVSLNRKSRLPITMTEQIIQAETGLHIIIAPKDTGKTYSIVKPALKRAHENLDFPIAITPLISLSRDVSTKCGTDNYQDILTPAEADQSEHMTITINSIISPRLAPIIKKSRMIVVDEIDAVYDSCTTGTVSRADKKSTFDLLQSLLGHNKAIVTGADIDESCLRALLKTRPRNEITIYRANPAKTMAGKTCYLYEDTYMLRSAFHQNIQDGEKCLFASDSVSKVEDAKKFVEKQGKKVMAISKNNSSQPAVQDFISNINNAAISIDCLAFTPSIANGLSIDNPHFTKTFGLYGQNTSTFTFEQMLARGRTVSEFHIACSHKHIPTAEFEKALQEAKNEAITTALKTITVAIEEKGAEIGIKLPITEIKFSDFDQLRIETLKLQEYERNPNVLLRHLVAQGMKIVYVSSAKSEKAQAKKEIQAICDTNKQEEIDTIVSGAQELKQLNNQTINEMVQNVLANPHHQPTPVEKAAMLRARYHVDQVDEELIKHDQSDGYYKSLQLEKTLATREQAIELDYQELKHLPLTLLEHHRIQQTFNLLLLQALGLKFDEFYQPISPENVRFGNRDPKIVQLVRQCYQHKEIFNGAMPIRMTEKTLGNPLPFIRNWAKTLGISLHLLKQENVDGVRQRVYGLNIAKLLLTVAPIVKRHANRKNSFQEQLIEWQNLHEEFHPGFHVSIWDALMPAHLADLDIYKDQPSVLITDN